MKTPAAQSIMAIPCKTIQLFFSDSMRYKLYSRMLKGEKKERKKIKA